MSIWAPKQSWMPRPHWISGKKPKWTARSVFPSFPLASNATIAGSRPVWMRV